MNAFRKMLDKAMRNGLMSSIRVGLTGNSLQVTHLLFANDTLVLCDADLGQILFLHLVLLWLEVVSRLKINMGKSELVPVDVVPNIAVRVDAVPNIAIRVDVLGCKQSSFPMKYLGLSLSANVKDSSI